MSDLPASARVTVVSVCFNSMAVLPDMLASVPADTPVVLVDNASTDAAAVAELAGARGARLVRNAENRGFGVACNQGAALAGTEFVLFLNPDAQLMPDTLDELVAAAERHPHASAMNPRIAEADGSAYFKRHSHLMPRAEKMPRGWPEADREVTVLSGAALFVRRADFEAVGGFDPEIFLYHEDDDLSRRLRAERGPLMFVRAALVQHLGGRSSVRSPEVAALKAWHMGRSRVYAARKHGQKFAFGRALFQATAQLLSPAVLLSKRKRAKQWTFFRAVLASRKPG
ncbi:glycosyltransferase family 2 protein [Defluviimonas sp. D31]|uniref:glycosyltransferase family 2 protein n=1 Tax=Defluviimonas sp. D31 TaxID=3083253 RepID=UPI00296F0777|nr:glycosyltransferase family 2 protein [Defluviimonas sp. D31]MDW4550586.1 glycosyltransferase family 2 protein [Defluviimonas sp. D31]